MVRRFTRSALRTALVVAPLVGICVGANPARPRRAATEPSWRSDARWAADRAVPVEWRDTWDETVAANRAKWTKELTGRDREARLRVRMIVLLEGLVARYPDQVSRHAQAYQDISSYLRAMNYHAAATEYSRKYVEASAGEGAAVADALYGMARSAEHAPPDAVEYACRRILALNAVGQVGDAEPAVISAHWGLAVSMRRQGRFMEAAEALEGYARQAGQNDVYRREEAQLYADAGHVDEALLRLQSLALELPDDRGLRERIGRLTGSQMISTGRFAGNEALTVKWSILKLRPPVDPVSEYAPLMTDDAEGQNVVPTEEGRFASLWLAADRALLATKPDGLAALRARQEPPAAKAAEAARTRKDEREPLTVFRRFPFAPSSHALLLDSAERALRRGHATIALLSFEDVIAHAADPKLIEPAKAGVELALAQVDRPASAASAPFNGKVQPLRTPGVPAWPARLTDTIPGEVLSAIDELSPSIQVIDGRTTLVAAPGFIACYGPDHDKPRWSQTPRWSSGEHGRLDAAGLPYFTLPGPFEPAVDGGSVYSRWGTDPAGRFMTGVVAFDLATGTMRWSTDQSDEAKQLWPLGDPCVGEGHIYYLAIDAAAGENAIGHAVVLACLDAADGRVVFRKRIGELALPIGLHGEREGRERDGEPAPLTQADFVHYGNRLTFAGGRVYASSNMGLVGCFDARDGMMHWSRTYGRSRLTVDASGNFRRQGAAPVIAGDRAIFLPRDRYGVLAVDRATGAVAWDRPFVPSERFVGLVGDVLVLCSEDHLVGLRTTDGMIVWSRPMPERRIAPVAAGEHVMLVSQDRLVRIDAKTGVTVEDRTIDDVAEPPRQLALWPDGTLLSVDDRSAVPAMSTDASAWHVPAANPDLHVPPPSANLGERIFALSAGSIHCVDPADPAKGWRRTLRPGLRDVEWLDKAMLLVYSGHVEHVDAVTGALRWLTPLPIGSTHAAVAGDVVVCVARDPQREPAIAGVEISTGQVVWQRVGTSESEKVGELIDVRSDGANVHLVARRGSERGGLGDFVLRPADGAVIELRDLAAAGKNVSRLVRLEGTSGAAIGADKAVHWFTLDKDAPDANVGRRDLPTLPPNASLADLRVSGPYASFRSSFRNVDTHWVVKRGDDAFLLQRPYPGVVRGERLYETSGRTLTVVDLATQRQAVQCVIPVPESVDHHVDILDSWEADGTIQVLCGLERGTGKERVATTLRFDTFDASTGAHRSGGTLAGIPYWRTYTVTTVDEEQRVRVRQRTQVVRRGGTLLVTTSEGVHALPLSKAMAAGPAVRICYRESTNAASAERWDLNDAGATLAVTHDGESVTLLVTHPDAHVSPRLGHGAHAAGDMLEIGLTTHVDSYRFAVGVDPDGQAVWENLGAAALPARLDADVRHDLIKGAHVYRVTIPLKNITNRSGSASWRSIGLSLALYDDAGDGSPKRIASFGGALDGRRMLPERNVPLYLHPLTPAEEQAAGALARALPELPAAKQYLDRAAAARADSPAALLEFFRAFLKADPASPVVLRTLQHLDIRLRTRPDDNTTRTIVQLATECGVPEPVRMQYERSASACLSQWVWIDAARPPRMLMLQLKGPAGWDHRVSFGQFHAPWTGAPNTPSRRHVGQLPAAGAWQELRIPLIWLDLHDKPIHGLSFGQLGGTNVLWDRTALVVDGKETILLDDETPAGTANGFWDWAVEPAPKSGAKSHTYVSPPTADESAWHDVTFESPSRPHVLESPAPADAAKTLATLEQRIPALGPTDLALDFLRAAVAIDPDPRGRYGWWLKAMPAHPRNAEVLADLLAHLKQTKVESPEAIVDALMDELKTPPRTRYAYRRAAVYPQRKFLTEWHVLGGFPNVNDRGLDYPFPPESEGRARLDAEYRGATEAIRWRPLTAPRDYVDLAAAGLTPVEQSVAYAVCWVHTDKARAASLELGHDDGGRVWVNRRLVHAAHEHDVAERGEHRAAIFLPAGWSEILVKVEQSTDGWGFFAELVDPEGRGPLEGVKVSNQPPNR